MTNPGPLQPLPRRRGRRYTWLRGLTESSLDRLFGGGWPARLAHALGAQRRVRAVHHDVPVARWPADCPPLVVAFASDLHVGPTTHPELLELVCAQLAAARPHVLLLGGDFIYLRAEYMEQLAPLLGRVPAPLGRFAVLGNHDLWVDDEYLCAQLERNRITPLINRNTTLPPPFDHVSVCGLDDAWVGEPDAEAAFRGAARHRIVLMHAPSGLLSLRGQRFELALCGHTHGGHIALPGGIPIRTPGPLSRRYNRGAHPLHEHGGLLVVSCGIGGVELPVRTFATPDIRICTLRGPQAESVNQK
jgi:predicted MPP superfamily phosphohydrolase